jgi:4a-hydroxytetrahydrobiopterin dehydratase
MNDLVSKRCQPCTGTTPALEQSQIRALLKLLHPDWALNVDGKSIYRQFTFKNYYQAIAFVNAVAWLTHRQNHHPDMVVTCNTCRVSYSTHAINALSENDFICAAGVDQLLADNE